MNFAADEESIGTARRASSPEPKRQAPAQAWPAWPAFAAASSEFWPSTICISVTEPSAATTIKAEPEAEKAAAAAADLDAGVRTSARGNHAEEERAKIVMLSSPLKITAACTSPAARDTATEPFKCCPAIGSFAPANGLHAHLPAVGAAPAHSKRSPIEVTSSKPFVSQEAATMVPWPATPCRTKDSTLMAGVDTRAPRPWRDNARAVSACAPHVSSSGWNMAGHCTSAASGAGSKLEVADSRAPKRAMSCN
mmetsp:Transcript_94573/g.240578  ORF Transcript_94573/g.240578 Transcript_94573/m.240578 type:complete len:252 (+) Transcript_94573:130-885(+)